MTSPRFRIEFSGKVFPGHYPCALTIPAPTEERAKEWALRQLAAWQIDPEKIRIIITPFLEPPAKKGSAKEN